MTKEREGEANRPPINENLGNITSTSELKISIFFHCDPTERMLLGYLSQHPDSNLDEIQSGFGFHRGNPKYKRHRNRISLNVHRLESCGYLSKEGTTYKLTAKGILALRVDVS